jgi:predicted ABC-type transport system involved in lysophospholipase L1 biosynthesis ATPase subunit
VTHDSGLAAKCDRTIRLRSGQIERAPGEEGIAI